MKAKELIKENIDFYKEFFKDWSQLSWEQATETAMRFLPHLESNVPHLVDEMKGNTDRVHERRNYNGSNTSTN